MDLSVCVVSMNHKDVLVDCLDSIYKNYPKKYSLEVIVVDNCSEDGTRDLLKEYSKKHNNLMLVFNKKIKNFSENNNIAILQSTCKYLLILNPDTIVHQNTLDYMVDYLKDNESVGAATCKLTYADGTFQESCRRFLKVRYQISSRLKTWGLITPRKFYNEYMMSKESDIIPKEVDWILGACIFIKRKVIDKVGLFDERFVFYFEDTDLCYRIKQAGWKVMYVPNVSIVHLYARTGAKRMFSKAAFIQLYTLLLFYAKHYWKILK